MTAPRTRALLAAGALAASLAVSGCSINRIDLDGTIGSESRIVTDFTGIELNGAGTVHITVGPEASLIITADTALLPKLRTKVTGGVLALDGLRWESADESSVVYEVTVPSLESLEISGEGDITVTGIDAQTFFVELNGEGAVTLSGHTGSLDISHNGEGDVSARGLVADDVTVELTGSGEIDVTAEETLRVELSGEGDVTYTGSPDVSMEVTGDGRVVQAD
jgi:hypothetical protein